nr:MAG TPA: hypothetical protein [Caudoviricetes sp.]
MELHRIIDDFFLLYSIEDVKRVNYIGNSAVFTTSRIEAVKEYLSHIESIIYKTVKLPHKERWDVYVWKESK